MSKRRKERVVYIPNQLYYTHTIYYDRGGPIIREEQEIK